VSVFTERRFACLASTGFKTANAAAKSAGMRDSLTFLVTESFRKRIMGKHFTQRYVSF
jgi:hypothetical protein